jgi:uncharacterized protein YjeT (DUF2065 family)
MMWQTILAAIGFWLAIEGIMYAAAPDTMRKMGEWLSRLPIDEIRSGGVWSAILGIIIFYAAVRFF